MAVYKILKYPHVLLRKKSSPVESINASAKTFIQGMIDTMYAFDGIGLAAPQVGILKRIIVIDIKTYLENKDLSDWHGSIKFSRAGAVCPITFPLSLVNPVISAHEGMVNFPFDGCLSLPGLEQGKTPRYKFICLEARDAEGTVIKIECEGILSICLQHEIDHLEGVLFIDHLIEKSDQSDIVADIQEHEDDPAERKRLRKVKPVDARNLGFQF